MSADLFGALANEVSILLDPLQRAADNPSALPGILQQLGVPPETDLAAITDTIHAVVDVKRDIEQLAADDSPSLEDIAAVLQASARVFVALRRLDEAGSPFALLATVGGDLAELLVSAWLTVRHPVVHQIATLLGLIAVVADQDVAPAQTQGEQIVRFPYRIERFHLDRLGPLLRDPVAAMRAEYVTPLQTGADADAMADRLFPRLVGLLRELGVACRYGIDDGDDDLLGNSAPLMKHALIVYVTDPLSDLETEAGFVLAFSSADRGDLGLVISPFGTLTKTTFAGPFKIDLALTAGIDVLAWGRHGLTLVADSATTEVSGRVTATLPVGDRPAFVIGSPTGTRLEVGGVRLAAETSLSAANQRVALAADVQSSALVIAPGDGDGFLADILPADGLRTDFDLGLGWASDTGLTFRGKAGLEATVPVGRSIGPMTLTSIHLGLRAESGSAGNGVTGEISASVNAKVGPVQAAIDRIGLSTAMTFPASGGNVGVANLDFGFKPPTGAGLSIDGHGVITGGGFLTHDSVAGTYAGVLQVSLGDALTLTAYGLIATKMPDGRPGYSLIVFIMADGFKPMPLGFGFMLEGIGGMLAVHRTFDQNVLRAGLKTDTLATLLFPRDPVANAPALLQALASAFPAKRGSFLLGLLARITWFKPTLITLDLALILELGARNRLLLLGRASALLPTRDNDLIKLNLDAMGVLDFDEGTLAADAVLVDSRLVHQFPITGSAALRARFLGPFPVKGLVLSAGGFNPRFAPPRDLPALERVAIALCAGSNPRLVCEAYLAITTNTVQFGARASLYAEAFGFSVTGDMGFDALVTILPPHFIVDFHASVQLMRGSHNLFKVALDGTLEGPLPLRIAARATFEILLMSFSVRFDFTLAGGRVTDMVPAVAVAAELMKALGDQASWTTRRASALAQGVVLRSLPTSTATVLDPLGQLVVHQQVVPLNASRDIDTFGGATVAGPRRFQVSATLNGQAATPVAGAFAPARYFAMTDDEKLAAPAFETMDAGLVLGDGAVSFDATTIVPAPLVYEAITLNPPGVPVPSVPSPAAKPRYTLPAAALAAQRRSGAAARVPARHVGQARFRNVVATPAATLTPLDWRIVRAADGAVAPVAASVTTWSEYRNALETLNGGGLAWQMVPAHELD